MLHAIQDQMDLGVPFFGLAKGTLNFSMNEVDNPKKFLDDLAHDRSKLDNLTTTAIKVSLKEEDKTTFFGQAVNEVLLGTTVMGYHHFMITSEDKSFDDFEIKGSGICISTDFGTTGYNFNLGSPMLPLACSLWIVSGVVCNRFLEDILKIQKIEIKNISTSGPIKVFLDGVEKEQQLQKDQSLILEKGDNVTIAFLNSEDFVRRRIELSSRYRK